MKRILLTGAAGFIGSKTAELLSENNFEIIGVDNLNDYYDIRLKEYRLDRLKGLKGFSFHKLDIEHKPSLLELFRQYKPDAVINLAARAGVRYSIEHPDVYISTNILGTTNLLELCRDFEVGKLVLASSSSLYAGQKMPFLESLAVNTPISPYATSKKAAEMMCYTYHYLFGTDITVLRYFTVYGPAGRPDMSPFRFIKWIDAGAPVQLFGDGTQSRDFTYVDDIAEGTVKALKKVGCEVVNLGGCRPHTINSVITLMEEYLGRKAIIEHLPMNKADVLATCADTSKAKELLDWEARIPLEEGLKRTVEWYMENREMVRGIEV